MFKARRMTNCEMFARSKTDQELIPKDLLIINKKKIRKICEPFGRVGKKTAKQDSDWFRWVMGLSGRQGKVL